MLYRKCIAAMAHLICHRETIWFVTSMVTYAVHKVYRRHGHRCCLNHTIDPPAMVPLICHHETTWFITSKNMLYIKGFAATDPFICHRKTICFGTSMDTYDVHKVYRRHGPLKLSRLSLAWINMLNIKFIAAMFHLICHRETICFVTSMDILYAIHKVYRSHRPFDFAP